MDFLEIVLNILYPIILVIVLIAMVILIVVVLIQSDKSGGLGILGGQSSQTGFGNRKAEPIVRVTQILGIIFLVGSLGLAFLNSLSSRKEYIEEEPYIEEIGNQEEFINEDINDFSDETEIDTDADEDVENNDDTTTN